MDIQRKLKFTIWILLLSLWALLGYDIIKVGIFKKFPGLETSVKNIISAFSETKAEDETLEPYHYERSSLPKVPFEKYVEDNLPKPKDSTLSLIEKDENLEIDFSVPVKKNNILADIHSVSERTKIAKYLQNETKPVWKPAPENYAVKDTKSFLIYKEITPITQKFLDMLFFLRGNLMIDLVIFSPWSRHNKTLIYLFDNKKTYHSFTGRPLWSQGASNILDRTVFVINLLDPLAVLAHELTHIYFDSFFNKSIPSPLWLSEGTAVLMQTERGKKPPAWLEQNLLYIKNGDGFKLENLMSYEDLTQMSEKDIRLWYAQSYSVVKFLMKYKNLDTFYQFCKNIKNGKKVSAALFAAYGMPFNKISSLEQVWRFDVKTDKITGM